MHRARARTVSELRNGEIVRPPAPPSTEQLETAQRVAGCSSDVSGMPVWDKLKALVAKLETAQRMAGCSFDVGGMPVWDKLKALKRESDMPEQISIFELVANASLLVQMVMALLALASIISWMMIFQRWFFLRRVASEVNEFEDHFWSGVDLRELYAELEDREDLTGIETVFVAGFQEFVRLSDQAGAEVDSIMQGVQRSMRVALNREEERLATSLAFLATVGSTSPYVGLFGTVWGIMNSFRSLANMSQATLASVAPGISEALVATAMGLFAAIPAVIGYNRFSAQVEELMKRNEAFSDEVTSILHRAAQART